VAEELLIVERQVRYGCDQWPIDDIRGVEATA